MKIWYSRELEKFVVSHLTEIIDSDKDFEKLLLRNGMMEPEPFSASLGDDYDADLERLLGDLKN